MSPFAIVYQKVSNHLIDLAQLPVREKFSNAVSTLDGQVLGVQEHVRSRLEKKSNVTYKDAADKKTREKLFEQGDMVMVYLRKQTIFAGAYSKLKPTEFYEYHHTEQLYPDHNSRTSFF